MYKPNYLEGSRFKFENQKGIGTKREDDHYWVNTRSWLLFDLFRLKLYEEDLYILCTYSLYAAKLTKFWKYTTFKKRRITPRNWLEIVLRLLSLKKNLVFGVIQFKKCTKKTFIKKTCNSNFDHFSQRS